MPTTGNAFAQSYANRSKKTPAEFQAAMWSASDSETFTDPAGGTHTVTAADVAAWMTACIQSGAEPGGNAVSNIVASFQQKKAMITGSSRYSGQELTKYFAAVSGGSVGGIPGGAFQYTGYTPAGAPLFFASRWDNSFATFDRAAYDTCKSTMGWYSMASPVEMFAEAYTSKYAGGGLPASLGAGKDFGEFFRQLESSPSIETPSGATPTLVGAPAAMATGEVPPPASVIP